MFKPKFDEGGHSKINEGLHCSYGQNYAMFTITCLLKQAFIVVPNYTKVNLGTFTGPLTQYKPNETFELASQKPGLPFVMTGRPCRWPHPWRI